jgi:hypothetical protein
MQQGFNPNPFRQNWREDKYGVSAPMGTAGGEKELIKPGQNATETHVRSRFDEKSSYLLMIIKQIGGGTKVIDDFVMNMDVASQAIDGLARGEYIMFGTGMISAESMPLGLGRGTLGNGNKRQAWNKQRPKSEDNE